MAMTVFDLNSPNVINWHIPDEHGKARWMVRAHDFNSTGAWRDDTVKIIAAMCEPKFVRIDSVTEHHGGTLGGLIELRGTMVADPMERDVAGLPVEQPTLDEYFHDTRFHEQHVATHAFRSFRLDSPGVVRGLWSEDGSEHGGELCLTREFYDQTPVPAGAVVDVDMCNGSRTVRRFVVDRVLLGAAAPSEVTLVLSGTASEPTPKHAFAAGLDGLLRYSVDPIIHNAIAGAVRAEYEVTLDYFNQAPVEPGDVIVMQPNPSADTIRFRVESVEHIAGGPSEDLRVKVTARQIPDASSAITFENVTNTPNSYFGNAPGLPTSERVPIEEFTSNPIALHAVASDVRTWKGRRIDDVRVEGNEVVLRFAQEEAHGTPPPVVHSGTTTHWPDRVARMPWPEQLDGLANDDHAQYLATSTDFEAGVRAAVAALQEKITVEEVRRGMPAEVAPVVPVDPLARRFFPDA